VLGSARGMPDEMSATKHESTRSLLAEIEGDWDAPAAAGAAKTAVAPTAQELHAALDAAADRLVESLDPPPVSARNLEELDSGWGESADEDDDDESDDDESDDDASEPALPDEKLDPVAYAAAKKARDERIEARRERRRVKVEAKKARRKARADAQKSKQKGKQRKARGPQKTARPERSAQAKPPRSREEATTNDDGDDDVPPISTPIRLRAKAQGSATRPSVAKASATKPMLSKTNQWMLGIAVVVFIAAATFAAVVAR
jgi:hypothetical protein